MASNRVGGPSSPEPGKGQDTRMQEQHRKVEKIEKVRAVDEAENERTRKKFQRFMDEDEEAKPESRTPSPFETGFHKTSKPSPESLETSFFSQASQLPSPLGDIEDAIVPSPAYSPPPDVTMIPENVEERAPLPQNRSFWSNVDAPPDQPLTNPRFKETEESLHAQKTDDEEKKKREKGEISKKEKEKKEALYGLPRKAHGKDPYKPLSEIGEKKTSLESKDIHKKEKHREASREGQVIPPGLKEEKSIARTRTEDEKGKKEWTGLSPHRKEVIEELPKDKRERQEEREGHKKSREKISQKLEIESPSLIPLPQSVTPIAQAATEQVVSFLSPQTIPLFFQMVGTIYVMTATPGVSKTEILLNAPSFANSKFFGATISIEKYATAPDSLNIRLTGSNEAVTSFNQNISNLYAAFQNGNFNFRIGRITAEYSMEKPVFRRKESGEGRSDMGEGGEQDRRRNR